jgi:hypothetical protein
MGSRSRVMLAALIGMVCIVTQTYGAATVSVRIVEQSSLGTTFEVVVPEMDTTTVMVDTMPFVVLTVEGANQASVADGRPQLLRVPVFLAVPNGGKENAWRLGLTSGN